MQELTICPQSSAALTYRRRRGAQDAKRAQAFTKIAREMIVAVKEGGSGDPANNSRLAAVIAKAKAANMPNDNIKRTIDKALGSGSTDNYESVTYEGYGPSGVAVIVEAMTDNRNRTASDVRHAFDKNGGNMGQTGCVSWSFDKKGVIVVNNEDGEIDEDKMMEDALEAGAADMEAEDEVFSVYTEPDDVARRRGVPHEPRLRAPQRPGRDGPPELHPAHRRGRHQEYAEDDRHVRG